MPYQAESPQEKWAVDTFFPKLERLLDQTPLPTSDGNTRFANVDEFMLMTFSKTTAEFKHIDSRRYIILNSIDGNDSLYYHPRDTFDHYEL